VLFQQRHFRDVAREDVVCTEVAAVEGEEKIAQPCVRGVGERVEDGVKEKLAKVVDGVGDEGGDAEVVGAGLALAEVEVGEVDAGEEEERILVVGGELVLGLESSVSHVYPKWGNAHLVVFGARPVERRMHNGLYRVEAL
jgi:hypothetical protein